MNQILGGNESLEEKTKKTNIKQHENINNHQETSRKSSQMNHLGSNRGPIQIPTHQNNMNMGHPFVEPHFENHKRKAMFWKILLIILVLLSVIGLVFIGFLYKNQKDKEASILAMQKKIEITAKDSNGKIELKIKALNPIEKIVYSWNNETENEKSLDAKGKTDFEDDSIEVPAGENTFTVLVQDKEGNKESFSDIYKNSNGLDIEKPKVNISTRAGMIVVEVTDNKELQSVSYKWSDDGQYQNVSLKKDEKGSIKFELEPKEGDKTLSIKAIDSSKNTELKEEQFKGVVKPKVDVKVTSDNTKIIIEATHPVGVKKVVFSINGEEYNQDVDKNDPNKKKVRIIQELRVGVNKIVVKAISEEGYESEDFVGQTERPQTTQAPLVQPQTQTQVQQPGVQYQGAITGQPQSSVTGQ